METARLVHFKITVDRQSKDKFPDSVQPFLREDGGAVCFFCGQPPGGRDEQSDASVDLVQDRLVQVHDVHAALPYGVVLPAYEHPVAVEEYGELVVGVSVVQFDACQFLCHNCLPPVSDRDLGFACSGSEPLKTAARSVTLIVSDG